MLRVTIELVPHGDETRSEVLDTIVIAQVHRIDDDPEGLRGYLWRHNGRQGTVVHRRSDGAVKLVSAVLARLSDRPLCPSCGDNGDCGETAAECGNEFHGPCPELPDNQESDMPDNERPHISAEDMALIAALVTKSSLIDAELYLKPSGYVIPEGHLPGMSTLYGVPVTRGEVLGVLYGVEVPELIPEAREAFESMAERVGDELG